MARLIYIIILVLATFLANGQVTTDLQGEAQLEALAVGAEQEPENDDLQQAYQFLLRHPLYINKAASDQLSDLQLLSAQQINAFIQYRELFGPIRNAYELQAIPFWDINTIRKVLPIFSFIETGEESKLLRKIISKGQHQLILRTGSTVEQARGYLAGNGGQKMYAGNSLRLFYRYTYQYKQQLWWGISGEKDAGEKLGDFTGFHLFIKRAGWLKTIALGDFTLNIGQGLVQWQGLAFGKTSESMNVFRQGNLLQPYRSAGEWNFNRGIATQFQIRHWELTTFGSARKQTANIISDEYSTGFSSISETGYHRTTGERADRNSILQRSYGTVLQYQVPKFRSGISVIYNSFSKPAMPEPKPYNLYAIRGRDWYNAGMHYSYTARNVFFFGEGAICKTGFAVIQGMVMSIHQKADLSLIYRKVQPGYQALAAHSFMENSSVTNETGLYTGLRLVPWPGWSVQAYVDYFRFPWLRFRADAPGYGQEYFVQVGWVKRKKWDIYLRYRMTEKPENESGGYFNEPISKKQRNLRLHAERIINQRFVVAGRIDQSWFLKGEDHQGGWAVFLDSKYQLVKPALAFAARVQYFNTGGYESRIYAYERDVLYAFSIPAFYDRGLRYYCQLQGKPARFGRKYPMKFQWWLRWSQTLFGKGHEIGSGGDEIAGNKKSDWKCQLMLTW